MKSKKESTLKAYAKKWKDKLRVFPNSYKEELPILPIHATAMVINSTNLDDFNYCPKCKSRNLSRMYIIPTAGQKSASIFPDKGLDKCTNCKYEDEVGQFEITNKINARDKKIDEILNEPQS